MSTARSRLDFALTRLDAVIDAARAEVRLEAMVAARPEHALGCTLHEYHEGECMVPRPARSRFTLGKVQARR